MSELIKIDMLNSKTTYTYIIIIVAFILFFSNRSIGLNIVFGIGLAVLVIAYLQKKAESNVETMDSQNEIKLQQIKPVPENFSSYREIVDFFFTIQDFYFYNPPAYEEIVDNTDSFMTLYEDVLKDRKLAGQNFELMEKLKLNAMNSLHSIIHKLPSSKQYTDKLDNSVRTLEKILNKYLNEIYHLHKFNHVLYGYDNNHKVIDLGPKAKNYAYDYDPDFDRGQYYSFY